MNQTLRVNITNFYIKVFALGLALKQMTFIVRKWTQCAKRNALRLCYYANKTNHFIRKAPHVPVIWKVKPRMLVGDKRKKPTHGEY